MTELDPVRVAREAVAAFYAANDLKALGEVVLTGGLDNNANYAVRGAILGAQAMQAAMAGREVVHSLVESLVYGADMISEYLEKYHDYEGDTPAKSALRGIMHHLQGASMEPAGAQEGAEIPEPLYKRVEAILDEHSAWIARPNAEVTKHIALAAMFAAHSLLTEDEAPEDRYLRDGADDPTHAPDAPGLVDLGERPCDCDRCDCGNIGDAQAVAAWDERAASTHPLDAATVRAEARREALEEAARIVEAECKRILAQQDGRIPEVDTRLRMIALLLPDIAAAIRHLADKPGEAEVWRPFETAPKDGTHFDVWYEQHACDVPEAAHRIVDVYWSRIEESFVTDGTYGPDEPSPLPLFPKPTHWRPLPAPPAGGRDGE